MFPVSFVTTEALMVCLIPHQPGASPVPHNTRGHRCSSQSAVMFIVFSSDETLSPSLGSDPPRTDVPVLMLRGRSEIQFQNIVSIVAAGEWSLRLTSFPLVDIVQPLMSRKRQPIRNGAELLPGA